MSRRSTQGISRDAADARIKGDHRADFSSSRVRLHIFVRADRALLLAAEEYEADCPPRQEPGGLMARAASITSAALQPLSSAPCPTPGIQMRAEDYDFVRLLVAANLADDILLFNRAPILLGI